MRLRNWLAVLAAIALAGMAWRDAAIRFWRDADTMPPAFLLGEPSLALAVLQDEYPAEGTPGSEQAGVVAALARSVLKSAPLTPGALRDLALADEMAGRAGFRETLSLAQRVSRRDLATQTALMRLAARDGDYRRAIAHLDRLLTVEPERIPQYSDAFAALVSEPEGRSALARHAAREWFGQLAERAIDAPASPGDLAQLLEGAKGLRPATRKALSPLLLKRLIAAEDFAAARAFAIGFAHADPRTIDDFGLSAETTRADLRPLSWQLAAGGDVDARFDAVAGVEAAIVPGATVTLLDRFTLLPAGSYTLEQRFGPAEGGTETRVEWRLTCAARDLPPIWRQPVPLGDRVVRYRSNIVIPPDCPAQHWQLIISAGETGTDAGVTVIALRINPA